MLTWKADHLVQQGLGRLATSPMKLEQLQLQVCPAMGASADTQAQRETHRALVVRAFALKQPATLPVFAAATGTELSQPSLSKQVRQLGNLFEHSSRTSVQDTTWEARKYSGTGSGHCSGNSTFATPGPPGGQDAVQRRLSQAVPVLHFREH